MVFCSFRSKKTRGGAYTRSIYPYFATIYPFFAKSTQTADPSSRNGGEVFDKGF